MAESSPFDLEWVLNRTGYEKYYPEKLTRQEFFKVIDPQKFRRDGNGSYNLKQLCEVFIFNIKFCSGDARHLPTGRPKRPATYFSKGPVSPLRPNDSDTLHPLDVITVVFLCCDPIARQDLVRLLWDCKFAIPFVVRPEQLDPLTLYTWPLKTVQYRPHSNESGYKPVTDCRFSVISFVRLGEIDISKSNTLNTLACQSSEAIPVFFHRDCKSSTKRKSDVVSGLIETTFASIKDSDVMFLNLRGDCDNHVDESGVLLQVSNVLVIFLRIDKLESSHIFLKQFERRSASLNILFMITDVNESDVEKCENIEKFLQDDQNMNVDIIPTSGMPKPDLMEEITRFFNTVHKDIKSIDIITGNLKGVAIDEHMLKYSESNRRASGVLNATYTRSEQQDESLFPLQGEAYRQWSISNKAIYRNPHSDDIKKHTHTLRESRLKLCEILNDERLPVHAFLKAFSDVEHNDKTRQLFLRNLNLGLESKCQRAIYQYQEEHRRMLYVKSNRTLSETDSACEYTPQLREIEEKMSQTSATLSSFLKEIGQIYETRKDIGASEQKYRHLPAVAVKILMDGYPIEIMDGKTTSVPINWVSAVLKELDEYLKQQTMGKRVKVKVLSILGIQSSGKSTLLNAMFGSTFAVGSGRCTRGVYLHIVKVDPDNPMTEDVDYIIVIDGEGISALEYEEDLSRERELATFILGIADVTILNIMSENTIYLRDILPISIHAFLRMDLVGLEPKCIIAHQNVDPMNERLLISHWHDLERTLDEYTRAACHLEGVGFKNFHDVVKLDITNDIHCFPTYRRQYSNVDVINTGYSATAMTLSASLCKGPSCVRSIDEFQKFIYLFWNALKRENFVYEFRSTVEAEARLIADDIWCKVAWKLRQFVRKALTNANIDIKNSNTLEQCQSCYKSSCHDVEEKITSKAEELTDELKMNFKKSRGSVFREPVKRLKHGTYERFKQLCNVIKRSANEELLSTYEFSCKSIKLRIDDAESEKEVTNYIKLERNQAQDVAEEGGECDTQDVAEEDVECDTHDIAEGSDECDAIFRRWIQSIAKVPRPTNRTKHYMEMVAENTLREAFPSHVQYISEKFKQPEELNLLNITPKDKYFSNITRQMGDMKQNIECAQKLIANTRKYVTEYFAERTRQCTNFDCEVFTELLSHTILQIEQADIVTKKTFQIDLAISTVAYALTEFDRGFKDTDMIAYTNLTYERFKKIYEGILANEKQKLATCLGRIKEGIMEKVLQQICDSIVEDIKQYESYGLKLFHSKRIVLMLILMELIRESDQIHHYFIYQSGWIRSWICWIFEKYCSEESSNGSKIQRLLNTLLTANIQSLDSVLSFLCSDDCVIDEWGCVLEGKLSETISLRLSDVSISSTDATFIRKHLVHEFEKVKEDLAKEAYKHFFEEFYYDRIKVTVTDSVHDMLIGCTETCPCCGELCVYGQSDHDGNHTALVHRPVNAFVAAEKIQLTDCRRYLTDDIAWDCTSTLETESTMQYLCRKLVTELHNPDSEILTGFQLPDEWACFTADGEEQKLKSELDRQKQD